MSAEKLITDHIDIWTSAVQAKSSSGRGSGKKRELYGIKKLRELILELAVRGKLVPQDPSDEPACELLNHEEITQRGLLKLGKGKILDLNRRISENEKRFVLPCGWEWTRLGKTIEVTGGSQPPKSKFVYEHREGYVRLVQIRDFKSDTNLTYVPQEFANRPFVETDIMIGRYGPPVFQILRGLSGTYNVALMKAELVGDSIHNDYLFWLLSEPFIQKLVTSESERTAGQSGVRKELIYDFVIALPPKQEQHRIVAKIDELMALCDQLEQQTEASLGAHQVLVETLLATLTNSQDATELMANWARISEHFDTLFTTEQSIDQLKQTILQLAVMGKLVSQDPNDEPAAKLLERIAEEKAQLVKEKKIKKQKALPPIAEDEKPFELPNGWEWCRFEDVVEIHSGITKGRKLAGRELKTIPYLSVANVQRGYLNLQNVKEIDLPVDELEKYAVEAGDLLITEGGDWDKVGRTAIWRTEAPYMAHQNHVFKARPYLSEQSEIWLGMYLNGPFARDYFAGSSKQTTNLASINKTQLRSCLIAVPPNGEKQRITMKVQELMDMCKLLQERIAVCQQTQFQFADAIVLNAL
ncbi:restriction endonuclease EcoAI subunit S [Photobacterium aquae]|uniref:Restriction endonuclease EcoAI subunit S n=1 Tax=Photobacterium aquae TaxID=1195763 RepID=A0A0J1K4B1_9GAMM|nr:restriction endonuclease subunit S [Photobacterium aquae]KLV09232.1 restriction endonuclease EcoAI subunit S [Photobacterium aquae]